jgi:drug/metabolite transporter (DMT)-like permease
MNNQACSNSHIPLNSEEPHRLGSLLALGSATFLGLNTSLARLAYEGGSNVGTVVFMRIAVSVAVVCLLIHMTRRSFSLPRKALWPIFGVGAAVVFQGSAYLLSVTFIPVGLAVLLFYTYPLMVALATSIVDKQKIVRRRKIAFVVAFTGIGLAIGPSFAVLDWRGIVLALMGGFGVMVIFMFTGQALKYVNFTTISLYSNLIALPLMAVVMLLMMDGYKVPSTSLGIYGLLGVCLLYALAILMQYAAIHSIGKTMTALLSNIEPLVSISAGALLLGETLSGIQYVGGVVVVTALVVSDLMAKYAAGRT